MLSIWALCYCSIIISNNTDINKIFIDYKLVMNIKKPLIHTFNQLIIHKNIFTT